jgi:uncharacterized protein (DUF849 family)
MEQKTNQQQQRQPALACTVNFHWFQWSLESSRAPQAALPWQRMRRQRRHKWWRHVATRLATALIATPVARMALELGGHLHIGIEEHFDPNRTPTNVELIEETKALCTAMGRPLATFAQTRGILGMPAYG